MRLTSLTLTLLVPLTFLLTACGPVEVEPTDESEQEATADLRGRWRFIETSGTRVADSSGNGNTATLMNGASLAPGTSNNAVKLDGVNDYVEVAPSPSLDLGSTLTVSLWVNLQSTGGHQLFLDKPVSGTTHVAPFFAYALYGLHADSTSVRPCFYVTAGGSRAIASSSVNISTGWHHLAGTYDGQAVKVYVDGVLRGSTPKTGQLASYATPLRFGINGGYTEPAKGLLDDVRIYSRALSACELSGLAGRTGCGSTDAGTTPDAGTARDAGTTTRDAGTTNGGNGAPPSTATRLFFDGFESGSTGAWACSGNCPSAVSSPAAEGQYAGRFELVRGPLTPGYTQYRTEAVPKYKNKLALGKEHWITMKYRFEDWATDVGADMSPFQVHMTPWSWSSVVDASGNVTYDPAKCTKSVGSAWSNAPFYMATGNGRSMFQTYKGKTMWEGAVVTGQWIDLKVHFKISWGSDGFIEAWMNGQFIGRVNGPNTVQFDDCGKPFRDPYLKTGIYKWVWKDKYADSASTSYRRLLYTDSVGIYRRD